MGELRVGLVTTSFVLPLRDAARGARSIAALPERLLPPPDEFLPGPLRGVVRGAVDKAREAREHTVFHKRPTLRQMFAAYDGLHGTMTDVEAVGPVAIIIAYAIERTLARQPDPGYLVSETVVAFCTAEALRNAPEDATPSERVARVLEALQSAPVITRLPGAGGGSIVDDQRHLELGLVAAGLWFLADRGAIDADDERVLDLCVAFAAEGGSEACEAFGETDRLASTLEHMAAMI
ncbi:MAG: hypothetical protein AAGB11_11755 [Pseudomonadota bacterium]